MVLFACRRSLQEAFPYDPSEQEQHDPHHLSCACAASPCSPVGPSPIILPSCIMLSTGSAAKMRGLFLRGVGHTKLFRPGPGVTKISSAAKVPRPFSPTFSSYVFWSPLQKYADLFFSRAMWFTKRGFGREREGLTVKVEMPPTACVETCAFQELASCHGRNLLQVTA